MLIKKYLVTVLFLLLGLVYAIFMDVLLGQPWDTFLKNFNLGTVGITPKLTLAALIMFLVVPDLYRIFMNKEKRNASIDPTSGLVTGADFNSDSLRVPSSDPSSDPAFLHDTYEQSRPGTESKG